MTGWVPKGEHALGQRLTNYAVHGLGLILFMKEKTTEGDRYGRQLH